MSDGYLIVLAPRLYCIILARYADEVSGAGGVSKFIRVVSGKYEEFHPNPGKSESTLKILVRGSPVSNIIWLDGGFVLLIL